jgi:hypothetical protein
MYRVKKEKEKKKNFEVKWLKSYIVITCTGKKARKKIYHNGDNSNFLVGFKVAYISSLSSLFSKFLL